jgi:hypothetical protein
MVIICSGQINAFASAKQSNYAKWRNKYMRFVDKIGVAIIVQMIRLYKVAGQAKY